MGRGRPELSATIAWIGLGCSLLLYFALIPILGAAGAAIASTLSYALEAGVAAVAWSRFTKLRIRVLLILSSADLRLYGMLWRRLQRKLLRSG